MPVLKANSLTENDLIQNCIKGDRKSQQELYNRYAGKMLSVCRRYARHEMEAEDIFHDAYIKVFKNIGQFQSNGSFEGWIRRIMVNTALKYISKKSFQNENIGIQDYKEDSIGPSAYSKLQEEELMNLINTLPIGYKTVFCMYVIDGYSHKEIGEKLNIGESTSRSQLVKARRLLQEKVIEIQKIAV